MIRVVFVVLLALANASLWLLPNAPIWYVYTVSGITITALCGVLAAGLVRVSNS